MREREGRVGRSVGRVVVGTQLDLSTDVQWQTFLSVGAKMRDSQESDFPKGESRKKAISLITEKFLDARTDKEYKSMGRSILEHI